MPEKLKDNKLSIPDISVPKELHYILAQLCGKSEDSVNYPNIDTFMSTYREPFMLSLAFGILRTKNIDPEDYKPFDQEMVRTIPSDAILEEHQLLIQAAAYHFESLTNPENTHEILTNPIKMRKIAEAFAIEGDYDIQDVAKNNFLTIIFDKLRDFNIIKKSE